MFIGYPHSGHSLIGALLNAHPEMVIAHELHALDFIARGATRLELFERLIDRSQRFTQMGSRSFEFNYQVPGQHQGRFDRLRIIGDKKGGGSALHLIQDPDALDKLRKVVRLPVRVIHAVRNPFDNIATASRRRELPLEKAADFYFDLAHSNMKVLAQMPPEDVFFMRHEDFVEDPRGHLVKLLKFLEVPADEGYLTACTSIIFESARQSRLQKEWPEALQVRIREEMEKIPFLRDYCLEPASVGTAR